MSKEEEKLFKSQEGFELSQEEIDKELDSQAIRVDQTTDEYSAEKDERLETLRQERETEDNKEVSKIQNKIKGILDIEDCKTELLGQFGSEQINWDNVEGRINAMLSDIQEISRSEKIYQINTKIAEHITDWLKQNQGKYDNDVLVDEALKHAVSQAENNYKNIEDKGNKSKSDESEKVDLNKNMQNAVRDFGEGAKLGARKKLIEYDKRIRDIIAKNPNNPRLKDALHDFKSWTGNDWSEDFSVTPENKPTSEVGELNIEDRKKLAGWEASYELAKIAKTQGLDLTSVSREEYVQLAIDNSLAINGDQLRGATWQRTATSLKELMDIRKKRKDELHDSDEDKEFLKFEYNIKKIAGEDDPKDRLIKKGIRVRSGTHDSGSWLYFGINNGAKHGSKETYKSYISLKDIKKLSPDKIIIFMEALRNAGYQGDIKTFQDMANQGVVLNDQVVMHGRTQKDAKLALQVAENYFGDELNQKGLGKDEIIDGKSKSYSQILAKKIQKEVNLTS